jgi:hypothetical protein
MSLDSFFEQEMVNVIQTLDEKIKQRRTQMLIHSYRYYVLDDPVISDDKWQEWADELVELQKRKLKIGFYDKEFADWTGATGMHLPFDKWVKDKVTYLNKISAVES